MFDHSVVNAMAAICTVLMVKRQSLTLFGRMKMLDRNVITAMAGNRFISITFVKKDGSTRTINGRFGVVKHLKGGYNTTEHLKHYVTIYSVADKGYRNINLNTIKRIKTQGKIIDVA
jgi:hypothetical protein